MTTGRALRGRVFELVVFVALLACDQCMVIDKRPLSVPRAVGRQKGWGIVSLLVATRTFVAREACLHPLSWLRWLLLEWGLVLG